MDKRFTRHKILIGLIGLIGLMLGNATGLIGQQLGNFSIETDEEVWAFAQDRDYTYLAGEFNIISTDGSPIVASRGVFLDAGNGDVDTNFPVFPNYQSISKAISDGNNGWFIAGTFTEVSGDNTFSGLVHVLSDGTLDANFKPSFNSNFVLDIALDGSHLYVAGNFTEVNGATTHPYAARLNIADGSLDTSWSPSPSTVVFNVLPLDSEIILAGNTGITYNNGTVNIGRIVKVNKTDGAIADNTWAPFVNGTQVKLLAEGGNLYIGGGFSRSVDNPATDTPIGRLVRYSISTGARDESFDLEIDASAGFNPIVRDMVIVNGHLYFTGEFTEVQGVAINGVAKVNLSTGSVVSTWNPLPTVSVDDLYSIDTDGSSVYVGGSFISLNGVYTRMVKIDESSAEIDSNWQAHANSSSVRSIVISGTKVFFGGAFTHVGGNIHTNQAFRVTTSTGEYDPTWKIANLNVSSNPSAGHIRALAFDENYVYFTGNFISIDETDIGGVARVSKTDGTLDQSWNPNIDIEFSYTFGGFDLVVDDTDVYVGGRFEMIGGVAHSHLAKFDKATGTHDTSWNPAPDDWVNSLEGNGDDLFAAGSFSTIGGNSINGLAKLSKTSAAVDPSFNLLSSGEPTDMVLDGNAIYAVGNFFASSSIGTLRYAIKVNFDGSIDTSWAPQPSNRQNHIAIEDNDVYIGQTYTNISNPVIFPTTWNGTVTTTGIAKLDKTTGAADPNWTRPIEIPSQIFALNGQVFTSSRFDITFEGQNIGKVANFICTNCGLLNVELCGDFSINSSGELFLNGASYLDTIPSTTPGVDSIVYVTATSEVNQVIEQDMFRDTTLVDGESLMLATNTNYAAYGNFDITEQEWVDVPQEVATALAGSSRSIFLWMRKDSQVGAAAQMLFSINDSEGSGITTLLMVGSDEQLVTEDVQFRFTGAYVTDGNWHHVGYTYDGNTHETNIYVDGVNRNTFFRDQTAAADDTYSIGQEYDAGLSASNFYDGEMTEINIWDKVLTESEVQQLMQQKISTPQAGLVAYYPMLNDCGQNTGGAEVYDYSGNDFHGTGKIGNPANGNLATEIINTESLGSIPGFNGAGWFNNYWIAPDGSTLSSTAALNQSNPSDGRYQLALINRHFAITDEWNVDICTDCSRNEQNLCAGIVTDSEGNVYVTTTPTFTDTLTSVVSGTDSLVFVSLTSEVNQTYAQNSIMNETLEIGTDQLSHTANTPYTAYGNFDINEQEWVDVPQEVATALAGSSRSIFLWMRKDSQVGAAAQMLFSINDSEGSGITTLLMVGSDEQLVTEDVQFRLTGAYVTDGNWHHVGYTYDGDTYETNIYVDGVIRNTFFRDQTAAADDTYSIGQEYDAGLSASNFYDGEMTEINIWDKVLTESEVQQLMQQRISTPQAGLVAYYPMLNDCGQNTGGAEVYDYSGNDFHGTGKIGNPANGNLATEIINTESLGIIPGFNGAGWFNSYWTAPDGSTVSTDYSIDESSFQSGTYRHTLVNRHFAITDEWTVTRTGNTDPTIAEAIADVTVVYLQADSIVSIADNFTDAESPDNLTFTVEGNTDNTVATASISGSDITIANLKAGTTNITVRGTDPDNGFVEGTFTLTVAKASPVITFPDYEPVAIDAAPVELSATSTSEESPITFAFVSGPASLNGTTLSFGQTFGAVRFSASQIETANFKAVSFFKNIRVERPRITASDVEYFSFEEADYGSQSYQVSGDFLIDNVTITAPANFEISTNNTDFTDQVTLIRDGNDLVGEPVSVFVRFVENPTPPFFAENEITHGSNDAVTQMSEIISVICESNTDICTTATTVSSTEIQVRWLDKPGSGADRYELQRATEDLESSYQLIHTESATGATLYRFTDTGLNPGQTYYYRVRWVKN